MHRLSSLMLWLGLAAPLPAQSPHGANFRVNCADCHLTSGWEIPYDAWDRQGPVFSKTTGWQIGWDTARFSHTKTNFPLTGQHIRVDCRDCHQSMIFSEAKSDCFTCHLDMHQNTVGADCARCHSTNNWLVDFIPELHQDNGFPLLGAHTFAACSDCHKSETGLRFDRLGNDCIACHQTDYETALNPNHAVSNFSQNCVECHTTNLDWMPAKFAQHDALYFPIYSGKHKGEWDKCADCHTDPSNYTVFSCTVCHTNPETDNHHNGIGGYSYNSPACLACHPTGDANGSFDHSKTQFPLKGKHVTTACVECHASGYSGTPTDCASCHQADYNQTNSPQHSSVGFPTTCADCHTETGWTPATFDHDDMYFPIYSGKHKDTWDQCSDCHTSAGNYAVFSCTTCHTKTKTDDDHDGVNGYSYSSPACLSCHPKGN